MKQQRYFGMGYKVRLQSLRRVVRDVRQDRMASTAWSWAVRELKHAHKLCQRVMSSQGEEDVEKNARLLQNIAGRCHKA
eukprot:3446988-Karenia_brevis.AAC.1